MSEVCEFHTIGRCTVPDVWNNDLEARMNRLYYIHSGSGGYIKDGERIPFKHNMLYLLPAFASIHVYSSLTDRIDHTYATFELIPPILTKEVLCIDPHTKPDIESALGVFMALCFNKLANRHKTMENYLAQTVAYLTERVAEENNYHSLKETTVLKALKLMHSKIGENISIADIAAECGMSTDGFIRKFKSHMHETPYSYLKKLKIRVAMKLRALGASWDEISERCGYADQSSLLHAIKEKT
ncbi:MAG: helix-turn-helix transcriptional regulator [Clostridia bacterium]|nr:helix-turn-helix transcriptional regulator [Clostridia bacterium]